MSDLPKKLLEAVRYFTLVRCNEYMRDLKWPDGKIVCPKCGNDSCKEMTTRPVLKCNRASCQKQFSYKTGTIFEDSPLGLDKWFVAVWSIANAKNGISSHELARALGVTQKTAWFMLHRIREAMQTGSFQKLDGTIELLLPCVFCDFEKSFQNFTSGDCQLSDDRYNTGMTARMTDERSAQDCQRIKGYDNEQETQATDC